ncbi:unannotated protein [freshwater metagenome]|uniref:Unannotated protein n=1 Tax=freshwater metagenome TaxID=449393 RepID=A0A6J7L2U5_9ZZZZ
MTSSAGSALPPSSVFSICSCVIRLPSTRLVRYATEAAESSEMSMASEAVCVPLPNFSACEASSWFFAISSARDWIGACGPRCW